MRNVFLLPTDQPSRLWVNNLLQGKLELSEETLIGSNTAQHIYITSNNRDSVSDEGVHHNYGSWVLDINNEKVFKTCVTIISGDDMQKIILTTDLTLIADGVQAIDDNFLEWFVKNPTCEFVDVDTYAKKIGVETDTNGYREMDVLGKDYRIIIPQEEPKQETLEEAAKDSKNYTKESNGFPKMQSFIDGANYMAERMYSEEDMRKSFFQGWVTRERFDDQIPDIIYPKGLDYEEKQEYAFNLWFEQFKKK